MPFERFHWAIVIFLSIYAVGCAASKRDLSQATTERLNADDSTRIHARVLRTYQEAISLANQVLKPVSRFPPDYETVGPRYSLIRYFTNELYGPDGHPHYTARVSVDYWTGELIELRGDYEEDEISKIERYRPADVVTPDEARKIATDALIQLGMQSVPVASKSHIDLVGKRYFVIRFLNPPHLPGYIGGEPYGCRIVIDGKTKKVLDIRLG